MGFVYEAGSFSGPLIKSEDKLNRGIHDKTDTRKIGTSEVKENSDTNDNNEINAINDRTDFSKLRNSKEEIRNRQFLEVYQILYLHRCYPLGRLESFTFIPAQIVESNVEPALR